MPPAVSYLPPVALRAGVAYGFSFNHPYQLDFIAGAGCILAAVLVRNGSYVETCERFVWVAWLRQKFECVALGFYIEKKIRRCRVA